MATINQPPTPPDYPQFLGRDWVHPYREQRIREYLEARDQLAPEDHIALQVDTFSPHGRELLPLLLPLARPESQKLETALKILQSWDFRTDGSSVAATIFIAWTLELPRTLLEDELEPPLLGKYLVWTSYVQTLVEQTIRGRVGCKRPLDELVTRSLEKALELLEEKLGPDLETWSWDRLHVAIFPHYPLHAMGFLRRFFSRRSPRGGDWSSVNLGTVAVDRSFSQRNIPGYRQVIDLSHPDSGRFIHALGQSGHFLSSRYDQYLQDWEQGILRPMRMLRTTVEDAAVTRWVLQPASADEKRSGQPGER